MADFLPAYERMLLNEGGYKLHTVAGDRGGMTYAGIARNRWPSWAGWDFIDRSEEPPAMVVRAFYRENFWMPVKGDDISDQTVAQNIFDFGVNAGVGTAAKLAQVVVGATPDGKIGPKTVAALNAIEPNYFRAAYALAKLKRYEQIVSKDRTQQKFLLGWLRRTLREAA